MSKDHVLYLYETAVGLGHQRRASGIVNAMLDAGLSVGVAAGSFVESDKFFDPRAELVPLPANRRSADKNGIYYYYNERNDLVPDPGFSWEVWHKERVKAIAPFLESRSLSALITEWWPFQRRAQFNKIIKAAIKIQNERFGNKPLLISSVRDITRASQNLQPGDAVKNKETRAIEIINNSVDTVLVHGDPSLVHFREILPQYGEIEKPVIYTGYVVNDAALASSNSEREKRVVVSTGSGDGAANFLKRAVRTVPLTKLRDFEWHFVMGPRMPEKDRFAFRAVADRVAARSGCRIVVHDMMMELPAFLCRSSFSVSFAGYNTTMEVLASGIPALLTPKHRAKGSHVTYFDKEQWKRLVRLQEKGMAFVVHPQDTVSLERFAVLIDEAYDRGSPACALDLSGAKNTAIEIKRMIAERKKQNEAKIVQFPAQAAKPYYPTSGLDPDFRPSQQALGLK
jgi:predicted glycosyltransferase